MTQTLAIFYQAYLNLNSKKLFWIVLAISGLVVVAFACVGINESGIKLLTWQIDNEMFNTQATPAGAFYKWIFVQFGVGLWLSWLATILALISTAGIFPDLITSGSIDLFVSKPISRLRLFLTEYVAGLLFVTLQVAIFSLASFLVIGLRGGAWEPGLFIAIPITVCFFSYLFSVCVFLGVATRSTVAALLLTLLFWFGLYAVGATENTLLMFRTMQKHGVDLADAQQPPGAPKQPAAAAEEEQAEEGDSGLDVAYRIVYGIKTVLPKTTETISMLERSLIDLADLPRGNEQRGDPRQKQMQAVQEDLIENLRNRSWGWVVGTSLVFEGLVLAAAAFIFCRRDY